MHNIGQPNKIVRHARIVFLAAFAAASPMMVVASPLTISGTPPTSAVVGQPYYFNPQAAGGDGHALTWSVLHEPNWTGFSTTTGYFNGTPTAQYVGNVIGVTISVTDGTTKVSLPSFNIHVAAAATRAPTITGTPAKSVDAGHAYAFTPTAKGPAGSSLSFSIAHKPSWASFSIATGELSGTPTKAEEGTYASITISVSTGTASAALPAFSIAVDADYTRPTIAGLPAKSVVAGQAYAFEPRATVEAGKKATFSITDKPTWASFSTTTGELSGTPAAANVGTDPNITIAVSDGTTTVALPAFAISVTQVGTKSATLSWKPPTVNSNGSALTNLAGYRIYYGTSASALTRSITINSVGVTTDVVTDLSPGTYYFALMAFNTAGIESKLSNVVKASL
jgi:hypothetical protein